MSGRAAASVALLWLLTTACACASNAGRGGVGPTTPEAGATTTAAPATEHAGPLGFTLTNLTGANLRAVYVSPSGSGGWEENVLGEGGLADGDSVDLKFSPEEKAAAWDIRVEGGDAHVAEWKGLRLGGVSGVTLYLDMIGERVVVAEVE